MDKKEVVKPLVTRETKRPRAMEFPGVRFLRSVGRGFILLAEKRKRARINSELDRKE